MNPQSWNRYAYVVNNPLSYVDPLGLYMDVCPEGYYGGDCSAPPDGGGGIGIGIGIGIGGGGGGGSPTPSGPTPPPGPPINVGSPIDPGMGNGPIWSEQIPISGGPINPYLIIQNFIGLDAYGNWTGIPCPPLFVGVLYLGVGCGYALIGGGGGGNNLPTMSANPNGKNDYCSHVKGGQRGWTPQRARGSWRGYGAQSDSIRHRRPDVRHFQNSRMGCGCLANGYRN